MRCPACGEEVVAAAIFCHKCGQRLEADGNEPPRNPPSVQASPSAAEAFQQTLAPRRDAQNQPEEELWRGGYSSKAMIGSWFICGIVSLILLLVGVFWVRSWGWWLALIVAIMLPWFYCAAVLAYRRMSVHYTLSTQRFIHERGILRRVNDRIELLDMDDITFEQSLWDRMTGVGTLRIASTDRTDPELVLKGIEDIKRVAGLFDNARLAERRRRGVHVEQI
jgi:hypothetical protein